MKIALLEKRQAEIQKMKIQSKKSGKVSKQKLIFFLRRKTEMNVQLMDTMIFRALGNRKRCPLWNRKLKKSIRETRFSNGETITAERGRVNEPRINESQILCPFKLNKYIIPFIGIILLPFQCSFNLLLYFLIHQKYSSIKCMAFLNMPGISLRSGWDYWNNYVSRQLLLCCFLPSMYDVISFWFLAKISYDVWKWINFVKK